MVPTPTNPIAFNPVDLKVKMNSNDPDDVGDYPYTVTACLANYCVDDNDPLTNPPITTASETITFKSGCGTVAAISGNAQDPTVPAFGYHSDTIFVSTLVPFTITPTFCDITHTCDSVTLENGGAAAFSCADVDCDADGNCSYTPSEDDYTGASGNPIVVPGKYIIKVKGAITDSENPTGAE